MTTRLLLALCFACAISSASVVTTNPNLPATVGGYNTAASVHACFPTCLVVDLTNIVHSGFTGIVQTPSGLDEVEDFGSTLTGLISLNNAPFSPITLTGPVETKTFNKIGNVTGTFATEMLSLNLSGGGILLRESPSLTSSGQTVITNGGGGTFVISSFFDVFTELSLDGGSTWTPSNGQTELVLTNMPEPATFGIVLAGLALVVTRKRIL